MTQRCEECLARAVEGRRNNNKMSGLARRMNRSMSKKMDKMGRLDDVGWEGSDHFGTEVTNNHNGCTEGVVVKLVESSNLN